MNREYIYINDLDGQYTVDKIVAHAWLAVHNVEIEEYQGTLRIVFGSNKDEASWSFFCSDVSFTELNPKGNGERDDDDERNDNDEIDESIYNNAAEVWTYREATVGGFEVLR